jgi:glycosyltransferase involved in cell wall biosynthesis
MTGGYDKLISVIIPTKNRYDCLFPVVLAILKYSEAHDIELIIQDNSDDNKKGLIFFEQLNDTRVKYFYQVESLSIQDNTIFAIDNASGRYLIFIGDDDLVSPYIYDIAKFIDKMNIKCLVYNAAYYWWNTIDFKKENYFHRKNALWLPNNQSLKLIERSTNSELDLMLNSGAGIFLKLPKFYHGIVRRDVLDEIKEATGTYLPGPSPDIAFSTALSLVLDKYYYINFPLSVFGASSNSGGGLTARKQHFGKIEDQKFLPKNMIDNWDQWIPKVWSEKTIYAQSVTDVLKVFKSKKKFNYLSFYANMLAYEPYLANFLMPAMKLYCGSNMYYYVKIVALYFKKGIGIFLRKLKIITKSFDYDVIIVSDVDMVMKELHRNNKLKIETIDFE